MLLPHQQTGFLSSKGEQRKRIIRASDWLRARPIFRRPAFWHRFRREENRSETRVEAISAHARHPPFRNSHRKDGLHVRHQRPRPRASAVRTNKRCVPTDNPVPGRFGFPREHRDDTRASVPMACSGGRGRASRARARRGFRREDSLATSVEGPRARATPARRVESPPSRRRARLRRIAPGVRFAVPRGRVFARSPRDPPSSPPPPGPALTRTAPLAPHRSQCDRRAPPLSPRSSRRSRRSARPPSPASPRPPSRLGASREQQRYLDAFDLAAYPSPRAREFPRTARARVRARPPRARGRSHPRAGPHPRGRARRRVARPR